MLLQAALLGIAGTGALVLRASGIEVVLQKHAYLLTMLVGIACQYLHGIVALPIVAKCAEDVVGKEGCRQLSFQERLLQTGVHVELMVLAAEAIVVARGVVQINHRLGRLADGKPIAEVHRPFWFLEVVADTERPCVEELLEVAEGERRAIEAPFGRGHE